MATSGSCPDSSRTYLLKVYDSGLFSLCWTLSIISGILKMYYDSEAGFSSVIRRRRENDPTRLARLGLVKELPALHGNQVSLTLRNSLPLVHILHRLTPLQNLIFCSTRPSLFQSSTPNYRKIVLSSIASRWILGNIQPPIRWVPG
jgi:hypothetical protein